MSRVRSSIVTQIAEAIGTDEFVLVEITKDGPVPVYDGDGQLLKFRSGDAAAREAKSRTTPSRKFQPRRVKDDKWMEREKARFISKEYQELPWSGTAWWRANNHIHRSHYPHVSVKNSVGLMAFTETDEKGAADVQTPIKPGKYLERYFSSVLDAYIIRDLCTQFSNKFEDNCLLFADTEDEFEALYTTGPSSCMSHPPEKFTSHIHPVRVYAAGDLKLAYVKRDGRIVGRALVYPDKKVYSNIYGDSGRLEPLLKTAGLRKGLPVGAKMQRVITWADKKNKSGNQAFVMPHIDGISWVSDEDDFLVIGDPEGKVPKNAVKLSGASGVTEWVSLACQCCKKPGKTKEFVEVIVDYDGNKQKYCAACANGDKVVTCSRSKLRVVKVHARQMFNGEYWWARDADNRAFQCTGDNKWYPVEMRVTFKDAKGRAKFVSNVWFKDNNGKKCETCGVNKIGDCAETCRTAFKLEQEHQQRLQQMTASAYQAAGLSQQAGQNMYIGQASTNTTTIDWRRG